jgi:PAS domain S-box-containing protein
LLFNKTDFWTRRRTEPAVDEKRPVVRPTKKEHESEKANATMTTLSFNGFRQRGSEPGAGDPAASPTPAALASARPTPSARGPAPSAVARTEAPVQASGSPPAPRPTSSSPAAARPTTSPVEQRLRAIIETAPVSLMVVNPKGEIVAANRAALALFGTEQLEAVRGRQLVTFAAEDDRSKIAEFVAQVCAGETLSLQYQLVAADGDRRTVETRAVPLRRDGAVALLGVTSDVGALNANDEEWRQKEQLLKNRCEAAESALRDATDASAELSQRYEELAASLTEAKARLEAHGADAALAAGHVRSELEALTSARASDLEEYQRRLTEHDAVRGQLQARIGDLETLAASRASDLDQHQRRLAEYDAAHDQLHAKITNVEAVVAVRTSEVEQLQRRLAERDAVRDDLQAKIAELEASEAVRSSEVAQLHERLADRDSVRDELQAQIGALEALAAARASDLERQHQAIAERDAARDELHARVTALEGQVAAVQRAAREALETAVQAERARYQELVDRQQQWRAALTEAWDSLRHTSDSLQGLLATAENSDARRSSPDPTAAPAETESAPADTDSEQTEWEF